MNELLDKQNLEALKNEAEDVILSDDSRRAFIFVRNFSEIINSAEGEDLKANPKILAEYQKIVDRLMPVAIPSLRQEEIVVLFKEKLLEIFKEERIDLAEKLQARLVAIPSFSTRDEWRAKLRDALSGNASLLGEQKIELEGRPVAQSVGNWIKRYEKALGPLPITQLQFNQFVVNDPEVKKLGEENKVYLRKLLRLYEYLKLSSQTAEGLEDPVIFDIGGKLKVLKRGELEDIQIEAKLKQVIDEVFSIFPDKEYPVGEDAGQESDTAAEPAFDFGEIKESSQSIFQQTGGEAQQLSSLLAESLAEGNRERGLAIIILLAQLRILDDLLADERFMSLVREDLKKSGQGDKVDELRLSPGAPHFVARFLKVVLQDKLGLAEADALDFGRRIARILAMEGEKYANIVSQKQNGEWRWNL